MSAIKGKKHVIYTSDQRVQIATNVYSEYAEGKYTFNSICRKYGVAEGTLRTWVEFYEEIAVLCKKAKENLARVEAHHLRVKQTKLLQKMAEGNLKPITETKVTYSKDKDGNRVDEVITEITKPLAPSVTAAIALLNHANRYEPLTAVEAAAAAPPPNVTIETVGSNGTD